MKAKQNEERPFWNLTSQNQNLPWTKINTIKTGSELLLFQQPDRGLAGGTLPAGVKVLPSETSKQCRISTYFRSG